MSPSDSFLACFGKAVSLSAAGQADAAILEFRQAISLDPQHAGARACLGALLAQAGRVDEAIAEFEDAVRIEPAQAATHFHLGVQRAVKGRYAEALSAFEAFIARAGAGHADFVAQANGHMAVLRQLLREKALAQGQPAAGTLSLDERQATLTLGGQATMTMGPEPDRQRAAPAGGLVWQPGQVVDELYEVRSVLGEGGYGTVHKVWHRGWGMDLAVKSLRADRTANRRDLEGFVQEANTWVGLGLHPNIVACYFVRLMGVPRIFIEYMEGGSLADWLVQGKVKDLGTALDLAIQAARAMSYAHSKGLVHRDLKPANCLVTPGGTVKVTDFGLAKVGDGPVDGRSGPVGTVEYMAPEQWSSAEAVDAAADAWAFGVMLFELCLGRRPFKQENGEPPQSFRARMIVGNWAVPDLGGLPGGLGALLTGCLSVDPRKRPAEFKGIASALERAYAEIAGRPTGRAEVAAPPLLADTLVNQGVSMADLGRQDQALALFDEALRLDPGHPGAVYDRGLLLLEGGRMTPDQLQALLGEGKRARPSDWVPGYLLGLLSMRRRDGAEAFRELAEAAILSAGNPFVLRAKRRVEIGSYEGAAEFFVALPRGAEGGRMEEGAYKALFGRAEQLAGEGRYGEAYESLQKARGVVGYNNAAGALALTRRLACKGRRIALRSAAQTPSLPGSAGVLKVVALADGGRLLTGHQDRRVALWETGSGRCLREFAGHEGPVLALCVSGDGARAVSSDSLGIVKLWELETAHCLLSCPAHPGPATAVALTPDGERLVSAGADGTLRVWNLSTGALLKEWRAHETTVNAVLICPDGSSFLSSGSDKAVHLWGLESGERLRSFVGHEGPVNAMALSADGRVAATAGADKTLRVWEVGTGRCVRAIKDIGAFDAVALTPDGRFAVAGLEHMRLSAWALPAGDLAGSFAGLTERITSADIGPDGACAYTAGAEGVRRWELDWELAFPTAQPWDDELRPYAEAFLARRARRGLPAEVGEVELAGFWAEVERRGLGWLDPAGVRARLQKVVRDGWGAAPPGAPSSVGRGRGPLPSRRVLVLGALAAAVVVAAGAVFFRRARAPEPVAVEASPAFPERALSLEMPAAEPAPVGRPAAPPAPVKRPSPQPSAPQPSAPQPDACDEDAARISLSRIMAWKAGPGAGVERENRAIVNKKVVHAGSKAGRYSAVTKITDYEVEFACRGTSFTKRL